MFHLFDGFGVVVFLNKVSAVSFMSIDSSVSRDALGDDS